MGNCQSLLYQKEENRQSEQLTLHFKSQQEKDLALQAYSRRMRQGLKFAVAVLEVRDCGSGLLSQNFEIRLRLEQVVRLNQLRKGLSHRDILEVLRHCLTGFEQLASHHGLAFRATNRMVGFNMKGEVRVWLSQNFADNFPSLVVARQTESLFVYELLEMLQLYCEGGRFPPWIRKKIMSSSEAEISFQSLLSATTRLAAYTK